MTSKREQESSVLNPFLNPIDVWQNYLIDWIEASRVFYENAIKANEQWLRTFWDPWLKAASIERKEIKVE